MSPMCVRNTCVRIMRVLVCVVCVIMSHPCQLLARYYLFDITNFCLFLVFGITRTKGERMIPTHTQTKHEHEHNFFGVHFFVFIFFFFIFLGGVFF